MTCGSSILPRTPVLTSPHVPLPTPFPPPSPFPPLPSLQPCSNYVSSNVPYCADQPPSVPIGTAFLAFFQMPTSFGFGVWFSIGINLAFLAFFTVLGFVAFANIRFEAVSVCCIKRN